MGHCYHHALSSVRKWGGEAEDFLPLHQWFDEPSKLIIADYRHRSLRHHAEAFLWANDHPFDGPHCSRAPDCRTACHRGSGIYSFLCRLGSRHQARTMDGTSAAYP